MSKPLVVIIANQEYQEAYACLETEYELHFIENREQGLTFYRHNYLKIRLVIIDELLIQEKTITLLDQLRKESDLPAIMVAVVEVTIQSVVRVMKLGANNVIIKPFNKDQIKEICYQTITQLSLKNTDKSTLSLIHKICHQYLQKKEAKEGGDAALNFIKSKTSAPKKVLVVEDEPIYRQMMADFLSERYHVIAVENAKKAIHCVKKETGINVMLCDLMLPDRSGIEVVSTIRKLNPKIEIITITAFDAIDKVVSLFQEGISDFINKPILKNDLIDVIEKGMNRYFLREELPEIQKGVIQEQLEDTDKLEILKNIRQYKKQNNDTLIMDDIYLFFPELKEIKVPGMLPVPTHAQENIEGFVTNLKQNTKAHTP